MANPPTSRPLRELRVRQADPGLCAMPRLLLVKTPIYCRDIVSYMWNKRPCGPLHFVTDLLPAASLTHGTFLGQVACHITSHRVLSCRLLNQGK